MNKKLVVITGILLGFFATLIPYISTHPVSAQTSWRDPRAVELRTDRTEAYLRITGELYFNGENDYTYFAGHASSNPRLIGFSDPSWREQHPDLASVIYLDVCNPTSYAVDGVTEALTGDLAIDGAALRQKISGSPTAPAELITLVTGGCDGSEVIDVVDPATRRVSISLDLNTPDTDNHNADHAWHVGSTQDNQADWDLLRQEVDHPTATEVLFNLYAYIIQSPPGEDNFSPVTDEDGKILYIRVAPSGNTISSGGLGDHKAELDFRSPNIEPSYETRLAFAGTRSIHYGLDLRTDVGYQRDSDKDISTITIYESVDAANFKADVASISEGYIDPTTNPIDDSGTATSTCESSNPSLGWFMCPVAEKLLKVLDDTVRDGVLENTLTLEALDNPDQRQALENVWTGFRSLANAGFVIAFFVFIYSAITGGVLAAYDMKKLAPKLLVGALAVQLSLFICGELIDLFNALGNGIVDVMLAPLPDNAQSGIAGVFPPDTWQNDSILTKALAGTVSALVLVFIIVGVLFALAGVFVMMVVFLIRNMALLVLTVISPLAFVAWILPNTEGLFKKWWGFYIQLLALFPIAMAFLASGRLVSYIWSNGSESWANVWVGMIALFAPYIIAPKMFAFAGSAIGGIVSGVNNAKDTVRQRGGKLGGRAKDSRVGKKVRSGQMFGSANKDTKVRNALNKAAQAATNPTAVVGTKRGRQRRQSRAGDAYDQTVREDEHAAETALNREIAGMDQDERTDHLRKISKGKGTTEAKTAAMRRMIIDNDYEGLEDAMIEMSQTNAGKAAVARFQNENAGDLSQKARHLLTADAKNLSDKTNAKGAANLAKSAGDQLITQHGTSVRSAVAQLQHTNDHASQRRLVETFDGLDDQAKSRMSQESKDAIEMARENVLIADPTAASLAHAPRSAEAQASTAAAGRARGKLGSRNFLGLETS